MFQRRQSATKAFSFFSVLAFTLTLTTAVFVCDVASAEVEYFDDNGEVIGVADIIGDVNEDCAVNFSDIPAFIECLRSGNFHPQADVDFSGVVDFSDIPPFIAILMGG